MVALGALVWLLATGPAATAAPGDLGAEDFSYAPLTGSPTQTKPESKLWFADGSWWGDLYSPSAGVHRIHRFDAGSDSWVDTGTTVDDRPNANADVLWHAATRKLYVASHVFTTAGAPAPPSQSGRVYRYSYDPGTRSYSLDPGFPVVINGARSEALTIAMDSTGRLWATWMQEGFVYATHSEGDDATWRTPFVVNAPFTAFRSDDISGVIAFGDNIGIFWSGTFFGDGQFYFAVHRDGAGDAPGDWAKETVPGIRNANDHLNLKADRAGRVFAAVKTSPPVSTGARLQLLRRDTNGTWHAATFGTMADGHTRPIVVLEDPGARVDVFATCPHPPATKGDGGGDICEKSTSPDAITFSPGIGTPVMADAASPKLNDVTTTKQPVNSATGLVLLANNTTDNVYWHRRLELSTPAPPPVTASFAAVPEGDPLNARFLDTSTGGATSWLWDFGDGTTSNARHPAHRYAQPGDYTVRLTAASATSINTTTVTQRIPVPFTAPPAAGPAAAGRGAPAPARGPAPGSGIRPATATRPSLSLHVRFVRGGRVRLYGSVSRRLPGLRIVLQRRKGTRTWTLVGGARLLGYGTSRSRFAFVLRRRAGTTVFRVVLPAKGSRSRAASRAVTVRPRR